MGFELQRGWLTHTYPGCVQASFGDWHATKLEQLSVNEPQTPIVLENEYDKHPQLVLVEQALYWVALLQICPSTFINKLQISFKHIGKWKESLNLIN